MDAGNDGVIILADKMVPPRKHGVPIPGPQAHAMKLRFEKYFLRKALDGYVQLLSSTARDRARPVRPTRRRFAGPESRPDAAWGTGQAVHTEDVGLYADQILLARSTWVCAEVSSLAACPGRGRAGGRRC